MDPELRKGTISSYASSESLTVAGEKEDISHQASSSSDTPERHFEPIHAGDPIELVHIASQIARTTSNTSRGQNEYVQALQKEVSLAPLDNRTFAVDPTSPDFDVYKWARMLVRQIDEEKITLRKAGITFKNLNVSGSGSAVNVQQNVGSVFMAPLRARELFSKGPEKQILKNFEGVVKTGEMLVVLGRPGKWITLFCRLIELIMSKGSGCSTFLKTLTGELQGLNMAKDSVIHYNGRLSLSRSVVFHD